MFSTSQDLLYVVLAVCILWFTVFLCWLLYQAMRVLRNANTIIEDLMQKLEMISDAIEFIRKKVDGLSSTAGTLTKMIGGVVENFVMGKLSSSFEERSEKKKAEKKK